MKKLYCITCPVGCQLTVIGSSFDMIVEGNKCDKGKDFAKHEMSNPSRTLTTTVRTKFPGIPVISVRTAGEIPRDKLMAAMRELSDVVVETELSVGDTVLENVAKTGISVIITSSALMKLGAELENKNVELSKRGNISANEGGTTPYISQGIGIVRNPDAVDTLGADAAGGFVGAAGEAVGVEDTFEDETTSNQQDGDNRLRPSGRPHIRK